jgi:hypothetical protein
MRYEIFPAGDGWNWRCGDREGDGYDTRREAIAAARAERDHEAVVLMRPDGSVYGELDPASGAFSGEPHDVTIDPAGENGTPGAEE